MKGWLTQKNGRNFWSKMENRKISFRAWDSEVKHMYYPPNNHIALWCDGTCISLQTGSQLIPLFCVGTYGKDGKEIYEGDYVKRKDRLWTVPEKHFDLSLNEKDIPEGEAIGKIIWNKGRFEVELLKGEDWSFNCPDGPTFSWDELEVIGNIFENSELEAES